MNGIINFCSRTHVECFSTRLPLWQVVGLVAAGLLCTPLSAAEFKLEFGGFYSDSNSSVELPQGQRSIRLDFEDDFKLNAREAVPIVSFQTRLNNQHRIWIEYLDLKRREAGDFNGPSFDYHYQGQTLQGRSGSFIASQLNIEIASASYGYPLWNEAESEFGVLAGLHRIKVRFGLDGLSAICPPGASCPTTTESVSESSAHPLLNIGVYGSYRIYKGWDLSGRGRVYGIDTSSLKGRFFDVNAGLNYQLMPRLNAYFGYSYLHFSSELSFNSQSPKFGYRFFGPVATLSFQF
ncbi:hypothetical protein [Paraferrimonas haliotis]|uniref:hypothetical protein n=1 Tax=Paraferrimonas haliotis TaxID=2013866 RepID=UPI000BA93476|nr:hypothetical protein [Paraferrimonas haliotis]